MFLLVGQCVVVFFFNLLRRLKVKVTLQGHVLYPSIYVRFIYPNHSGRFYLNFTQMFISVSLFAEPVTLLCKLNVKVTLQGHVI